MAKARSRAPAAPDDATLSRFWDAHVEAVPEAASDSPEERRAFLEEARARNTQSGLKKLIALPVAARRELWLKAPVTVRYDPSALRRAQAAAPPPDAQFLADLNKVGEEVRQHGRHERAGWIQAICRTHYGLDGLDGTSDDPYGWILWLCDEIEQDCGRLREPWQLSDEVASGRQELTRDFLRRAWAGERLAGLDVIARSRADFHDALRRVAALPVTTGTNKPASPPKSPPRSQPRLRHDENFRARVAGALARGETWTEIAKERGVSHQATSKWRKWPEVQAALALRAEGKGVRRPQRLGDFDQEIESD